MSIQRIGSGPIRRLGREDRTEVEQRPDGDEAPRSQARPDRADLSPEGLAMADKLRSVEKSLSSDRISEIEARIANGFYDDPSVARVVAGRILASGDLESLS